MPAPLIKGRVILDSIQFTKDKLGEPTFQTVVARLDEPHRKIIERGLVQSGWYPADLMTRYLEIEIELFGLDPLTFRRLAEEASFRQLTGTYSGLLQTDPEASVRKSAASAQTYFKNVRSSLVSIGGKGAVLRFEGFGPSHSLLEPLICGYARQSLVMNGAKSPTAKFIVPIGDRSGHADMELAWE